MDSSTMGRTMRGLAAASVVLALFGCGWFEDPSPEEARVSLSGDTGTEVRLVVSTRFVASQSGGSQTRAELITADTLVRALPFDTTFDIRADQRFYALADTVGGIVPGSFRMRVLLDGGERYDEEGSLVDRVFRFLYIFNQPILRDDQVL